MASAPDQRSAPSCAGCGAALAPSLLACPSCRRLVHADALKSLAAEAERAQAAGDLSAALAAWRGALDLLPRGSRQHDAVAARVAALSRSLDAGAPAPDAPATSTSAPASAPASASTRAGRGLAGLGAAGLVLWKFKFVVVAALSKAKLLLVGFTKLGTLLSMAATLAVYWAAFGLRFAVGLLLSLYVHEVGHVAALRRYGIAASAPMFVPGLGAFVRLKQYPADAREDARIGLAGPVWGLAAALVAFAVGRAGGFPTWLAIARVGAWINLFNLAPVWQLDGARGFRALTLLQRRLAALAVFATWLATGEGMLFLVGVVAAARCLGPFSRDAAPDGDRRAFVTYLALVVALGALASFPVPAR